MTSTLYVGDCREVMSRIEPESIDEIVTDPPYGLGFMGKDWDTTAGDKAFQAWCEDWAIEAYRVLKPGGYLLAFGGTRTYHRLTCGLEDAGFEIRDCLIWLYGSGFPKSHDVSKAIDKSAGAEREVVGDNPNKRNAHKNGGAGFDSAVGSEPLESMTITSPATDAARQWDGWGTALKPAWEPIVVARKPLAGTVAANVLEHGTGAINVDACRIDFASKADKDFAMSHNKHGDWHSGPMNNEVFGHYKRDRADGGNYDAVGRWPANVVLDEEAAAMLDEQSGELSIAGGPKRTTHNSGMFGIGQPGTIYKDTGGASRFFYTAKASRSEREIGLYGAPSVEWRGNYGDGIQDNRPHTKPGYEYRQTVSNNHPTVKPIDLMQWLCRLVTKPGGSILDPFVGSGSTGIAAEREGFAFTGIDQSAEYIEISRRRITGDAPLFNTVEVIAPD